MMPRPSGRKAVPRCLSMAAAGRVAGLVVIHPE